MKPKNRDEKRRRRGRTAARKCKERLEYREKYGEQDRGENELRDHNRKLESGLKKAAIFWGITFIGNAGFLVFLILFAVSRPDYVFLNSVLSVLFIASVFLGMLVFAKFISRCQYYVTLGDRPSLPSGVRLPVYSSVSMDRKFEEINPDDYFTDCSAKRIVITNDPQSGDWLIPFVAFVVFLYFSLGDKGNFWTSGIFLGLLLCFVCLSLSVFLFVYHRKKTFIIDREAKTITIPPVSCLGKGRVVPWQQVVVAFCSGMTAYSWGRRTRARVTHDYLVMTTKANLPYGPRIGFRCDWATEYRFARLICEYMTVPDLDDMPDIQGFEGIIAKIKAK